MDFLLVVFVRRLLLPIPAELSHLAIKNVQINYKNVLIYSLKKDPPGRLSVAFDATNEFVGSFLVLRNAVWSSFVEDRRC